MWKESVDTVDALINGRSLPSDGLETKDAEPSSDAPDYSSMNKAEVTAEAL